MSQHYCLRWNNYQSNMTSVFHHLLRSQAFVDVTLACNEQSLKAHKVVLSACSSYFQKLLMENPCKHPTIIMPQDICFSDLKFIIEFVYRGEIDVSQAELQSLLKTADQLKIKGLCEVPEKESSPPPPPEVMTLASPRRHRHRPHKRRLHESLSHIPQPDYQIGGNCMDAATSTEGDIKLVDETSRDGEEMMEISHSMSPSSHHHAEHEHDHQLDHEPHEHKFENGRSAEMTDRGVDAGPLEPSDLARQDAEAQSNHEYNEEGEPVKVKYETLRTIDQSETLGHLDASPASSDVKDDHNSMQTMMITPELLGLLPTSHGDSGGSGSSDMCEGCPKQSKNWTADDMEAALDALRNQAMSLTKASLHFGIPSTTLWQRAHRLGIDTPKKDGPAKSWTEDSLNVALDALRSGTISANKASKAYGIPSSTLYKIARREGIRLAAPFNAAPTTWNPEDLERALEAIRSGQTTVQRAAADYGIPSGTLYGRCKREGIGLTRNNPTPWSEQAMNDALEAVRIGQMSINQAAISFNLPYSSLYGRFKRGKFDSSNGNNGSDEEQHSEGHPTSQTTQGQPSSNAPTQSQASNGPSALIQATLSSPPPPQPQIMLVQYQAPVQPPAIHMYTQPAT